jgi:hypothetical protein
MHVEPRPTTRVWVTLIAIAFCSLGAAADKPVPQTSGRTDLSAEDVQQIVAGYFSRQADCRPGDIITQSDVAAVLQDLAAAGWQPPDHKQLLANTLPDDNAMVSTLRTEQGQRFMRKVSGYESIYDRLDRVSQVSGGQRTIDAIVRLPDGEKYAQPKKKTPHGVPDFLDLLPKNASGKVRSIKDYDKPTGRIYTEADLVSRLSRSLPAAPQPEPGKQ